MATLITMLISLLGYGSPEDFQIYTEAQLESEIIMIEQWQADGGLGDWDTALDLE